MITAAQKSRLADIVKEIESAGTHPSLVIRVAHDALNPFDVAAAIREINRAILAGDGFAAYHIIKKWHAGGFPAVVRRAVNPSEV